MLTVTQYLILRELAAVTVALLACSLTPAWAILQGRTLCKSAELGLNAQQQNLCAMFPQAMPYMSEGESNGLKECTEQMRNTRWACHVTSPPIFSDKRLPKKLIGTREHAYLSAVLSAAIVSEVTRSCRNGRISNCQCSTTDTGNWHFNESTRKIDFQWGHCSDDPSFALKITKEFVDAEEANNNNNITRMVILHNNSVGRRLVNTLITKRCTCWGMSGSCTTRTCRNLIPVNVMKMRATMSWRIRNATMVTTSRTIPARLVAASEIVRSNPIMPDQLVYAKLSPKFCNIKSKRISPGINGRECIPDSNGTDGCQYLCCGHQHKRLFARVNRPCKCTLVPIAGGYYDRKCSLCSKAIFYSVCTTVKINPPRSS